MLLVVSLLSALVVGVIGYLNGRDSLRAAAFAQLTSIRELRTEEIETTLAGIQRGVRLDSRTTDAVQASAAFNDAFAQLEAEQTTPADQATLDAYYQGTFVPELEQRSGLTFDQETLEPASVAGRYLQAHYAASDADFDAKLRVEDAGDGSAWSAEHRAHHPFFEGLVDQLGYEDVLLINTTGDVVYTAYKGTDLGVNLREAPYTDSALTAAYDQVMRTGALDTVVTTDFERWIPSLYVPTMWIVSPIGSEGEVTGAMAVQVPIDQINATMSGSGQWSQQGLGHTGEVYLVGEDRLMRSVSRPLQDAPESYAARAIAAGTPPDVAKRIAAIKGTVLLQPVETAPVDRALRGTSGTAVARGYLGESTLSSYAPLEIDGPRWVIVAQMDTTEAFAPVRDFTRTIALSTAALVLLITLLSLLFAQVFTRPIGRLVLAVQRVAGGERDVEVQTGTRDEFAQLGRAFNDMSRSLQLKTDLLEEQQAENERLLLTLMPEAVATRYRSGDATIAEDHSDVSVIYADIVGFDDLSADLSSEDALALLNEIVTALDEAATRLGVERVRTTRQGYLASCGLTIPRVDSAKRVVDFAREAERIVERIGSLRGARLGIRAGIDSGTVTSGLVGRQSVVYDLWGDAVSLAYRLQSSNGGAGIYITQRVVDRLPRSVRYADAGTAEVAGELTTVWRVDTEPSGD